MKRLHVAVIGFGRLGKACARVIIESEDLALAGVVHRPASPADPPLAAFASVPMAGHVRELAAVDAALLCVPPQQTLEIAHDLLQFGLPIVECAMLHGDAFQHQRHEIDRLALRHGIPAVVGAGWDPGMLSVFRALFAALIPKGESTLSRRSGINLVHSLSGRSVPGVKAALSAERRDEAGRIQRYVYVELATGADPERVAQAIKGEPLFLGEDTLVFPVESVAALEEEGHGILLERRGGEGMTAHQLLLLEARFDVWTLASEVMVAAARALPTLGRGAKSLFELPPATLWRWPLAQIEREWL